jgi:NAD(P)-dependent dehydrogenase (short-subunit alcohol dehydrogenase family)
VSRSLAGTTALVTGAARRLGRAVALGLADAGADVALHYSTSGDAAEQLAAELRHRGRSAWTLRADLADPDAVASLIPRAREQAERLDILVNNASIFPADGLREARREDLLRCLEVNAWAPLALSRAFAENLGRGAIVNFLDTRIVGYDWKHVSYIISKNALALLTRMMALEFAPAVAVNAVAPGLILPPPGEDESYLDALADTVPLKRHGDAQDIVDAVIYLLQSEFVTGQIIYVDGGRHLMEYERGPDSH